MASAMGAGTPRRARRVETSMGVPVRVWWSAATLRAWSIRAAGTGTAGRLGGASTASWAGSSGADSGLSSWSSTTSTATTALGAEWARRVPPRKATAGQPATRMRSQAGTSPRSSRPAVATFAPSDAVSAMTNQHQPEAFASPVRSRRQAATSRRSTLMG